MDYEKMWQMPAKTLIYADIYFLKQNNLNVGKNIDLRRHLSYNNVGCD